MKNTLIITGALAFYSISAFSYTALAADVDAGKTLYIDNCQRCHGTHGQGGVGVKLTGDSAWWTADLFKRAVLEGVDDEGKKLKAVMPRWGKTGLTKPKGAIPTDADIANIQAYIQTFGPQTAK